MSFSAKHALGDVSNMVKAFIGASYLSMPFAFKNCGIAVGLAIMAIVIFLTDHCLLLLINCKRIIIDRKIETSGKEQLREKLARHLTYSDLGAEAFGNWGRKFVDFCLISTQFMFSVIYFIFIGGSLYTLIPKKELHVTNITDIWTNGSSPMMTLPPPGGNFTVEENQAPPKILLVLTPLPVFLCFVFVRSVRHIAPMSIVANFFLGVGFVGLCVSFVIDFEVNPTFLWVKWSTLPVFIGQISAVFEGIGMVVPIEASMHHNRKFFHLFLDGTLFTVGLVYAAFGIVAYLKYGEDTPQAISDVLTANGGWYSYFVNICLMLAILFTQPLMFYPVIEVVEGYLFQFGKICGPSAADEEEEDQLPGLENSDDDDDETHSFYGSAYIPKSVPAWKRNSVRIILLLVGAAVAIPLRNSFAYLASMIGGYGSITLAYLIPCAVHIKITWNEEGRRASLVRCKNAVIVCLSIAATCVSLTVTIKEMIEDMSKH